MDHYRNRGVRCGDACPDHVGTLYTLADNDTAPCDLVAEALLSAAAIHSVVDLDLDGIVSDAAAAP